MKKSVLRVIALMLVCVLMLVGCSSNAPKQEQEASSGETKEVIQLNLGHSGSTEHHYQKSAEKFAQIVAEKTNGQIKVNIFPADQLGAGPELAMVILIRTSYRILNVTL